MDTNDKKTEQAIENFLDCVNAILYALYKDDAPVPESFLYIATGMNHARFQDVRSALTEVGYVNISNNLITLTDKGKEIGKLIAKVIDSAIPQFEVIEQFTTRPKNPIGFNPSKPIPEC